MNTIQFYKANGTYGFLSNLFKASIIVDDREFPTAEHAYQYAKFTDKKAAEWAMQAPSAHLVAIVAHGLFAWDIIEHWAAIKVDRMRKVVLAKFSQHDDLRQRLWATGDAHLVEASRTDAFWGIGKKGNGQNMLGKVLMETRAAVGLKWQMAGSGA